MNAETVTGAIAGGLSGLYGDVRDQRARKDRLAEVAENNRVRQDEVNRKRQKDTADETERQRMIKVQQEIIDSMPDANPDGSPNSLKTALRVQYGFKGQTGNTMIREAGQTERHNTVSGNAVANNKAAMDRVGAQVKGAFDRTFLEEQGRNDRWGTASGNATLGSETTRRGQDISSTTARRGQDLTAGTSQRGQDLNFSLGTDRNLLTQRDQDIDFALGNERNATNAGKRSIFDVTFGDAAAGAPAAAPAAQPAAAPVARPSPKLPAPVVKPGAPPPVAARAPIPVTPRAAAPATGTPAPNPAIVALTTQATQLLAALGAEKDPARAAAIRKQLADIRAQIVAARGR